MASNFHHAPLADAARQIRLLKVHPDAKAATLRCTLEAQWLAHYPSYVAISYTWGSSVPDSEIWINGHRLAVAPSCYRALDQMRVHEIDHWVWIDAVCINQVDDDEKSLQVELMGEIYEGASEVIVCLDCGDNLTVAAAGYGGDESPKQSQERQRWVEAVQAIRSNKYFTRMWVVQEVGLNENVQLCSGRCMLSWLEFLDLHHKWRGLMTQASWKDALELESRRIADLAATQTVMGKSVRYKDQAAHGKLSLTGLVGYHLDRTSTDPRDKIFALLPMIRYSSGGKSAAIGVDYRKSTFMLLLDFMASIRFSLDPTIRINSFYTAHELWTGWSIADTLTRDFKPSVKEVQSFYANRQPPKHPVAIPHQYLATHFIGKNARVACSSSDSYWSLVGNDSELQQLHLTGARYLIATWAHERKHPEIFFLLGESFADDLNCFLVRSFHSRTSTSPVDVLASICDCPLPACPGKRSVKELLVHPLDLLALALATEGPQKTRSGLFTTAATRSFVRLPVAKESIAHPVRKQLSDFVSNLGRSLLERI